MKFRIALFIAVYFLHNFSSSAQVGNYRYENFGNLSILLSGNVTGSVTDLGLTYYNPARLPFVDNNVFTLSAKSYQFNKVVLNETFEEDKKLTNSEFEGIPSMVAGTFKIDQLENSYFAYAFISKSDRNLKFNYQTELRNEDILDRFEGDELFNAKVGLKNVQTEDWFGVTWGQKITDKFSIGVSTFFSIYKYEGGNDLRYAALHSDEELVSLYVSDVFFQQKSYGLYWKVGMAWELNKVNLGLNINLPYLEIYDEGKLYYEEFLAGIGSNHDKFIFNKFEDLDGTKKEPFGIAAGAGITIGKSTLHLNVEWYNKLNSYNVLELPQFENQTGEPFKPPFSEALNSVINFGMGAELYISPKIKGFASFSTDYSAYKKNANLFDLVNSKGKDINYNLDYMHYGGGFDMKFEKIKLVLGATYSYGESNFTRPIEIPSETDSDHSVAGLKVSRWRFIVGIDIPILEKKLKEVEDKSK